MQVVIICGGKGSRLKKNYESTPKALIEFKQKPNLHYQIDQLKKNGHETIRVNDTLGGGQIIRINWKEGLLIGGSDPRKDGLAIGY